jgi:lysophospholipase L1-like esterase
MPEIHSSELNWKQKLFLVLIVPIILLGILEVIFRIAGLEKLAASDSTKVQLEMPSWMLKDANALIRNKHLTQEKGSIDWFNIFEEGEGFRVKLIPGIKRSVSNTFSLIPYDKDKKYLIEANSLGFRGPELKEKKDPGTYRILIFGDSSSFGWGVDQEDTFYYLMQKKLSADFPGKKIEIGNFAIPGDSSEYGKLIVDKYLPRYESDLVIFGFGANDAKKTFVKHKIQVEKFKSHSLLQTIKYYAGFSAIFRTLSGIINPPGSTSTPPSEKVSAVSQKEYADNLAAMGQSAKNNNSEVLLLNLCTPGNYAAAAKKVSQNSNWLYFNGQKYLLKKIPDIKEKLLEPQLAAEMEKNYPLDLKNNSTLYITSDGCHPNKLGNRLIAEKLTTLVEPSIK